MQKCLLLCFVVLVVIMTTSPKSGVQARTLNASNKNDLSVTTHAGLLQANGKSLGAVGIFGRRLTGYFYPPHRRQHDDDDDDSHSHKKSSSKKSKKGKKSKTSKKGKGHGHPPSTDSSSIANLMGVLRVVVYGNGEACFVKVFQNGHSYGEQFGDGSTSASGFIDLYGHGECEPGAVGFAYGVVEARVVAEAHRRGNQCESSVLSYVTATTHDLDPNDGVNVLVGGAAGGEALAVCP